MSVSLEGVEFLPGIVGLNNIKRTDYVNAVIQSLTRASLFRNFFMNATNYAQVRLTKSSTKPFIQLQIHIPGERSSINSIRRIDEKSVQLDQL
jgi:hypothetical protein